jgi:hypothetical protein
MKDEKRRNSHSKVPVHTTAFDNQKPSINSTSDKNNT